MLRYLVLSALFAAPAAAVALSNPSAASLVGPYRIQMSKSPLNVWSATKTCTYGSTTLTFSGGGMDTSAKITYGTLTFDGRGHVSLNVVETHAFDQAASNATVHITCPATANGGATVDNGHPVFQTPQHSQLSATYSVDSGGEGSIMIAGDGGGGIDFDITDIGTNGIGNILIVRAFPSETSMESGIAVRRVNGDVRMFGSSMF